MSTQAADTSVRHAIVVEAPIERAFKVFTEDFGKFKPAEHNLLRVPIAETEGEGPKRLTLAKTGPDPLFHACNDGSMCR